MNLENITKQGYPAAVITIGDEILIGQIVDTNSAWIGRELGKIGIPVTRIVSIADNRQAILDAVGEAVRQYPVTIITGGLGPTKDDITKKTLAEYFSMPLVRDERVYAYLKEMLRERGIAFNELNESQALVPQGCQVLHNANGTAPGMMFETGGHLLFSLPGVPFEMQGLMKDEVIPAIKRTFTLHDIVHRTVITYGLPESELAEAIAEWENGLPASFSLAYLPNPKGVRLRLSAYNISGQDTEQKISEAFEALKKVIPQAFLGYEDAGASLERQVAERLTRAGKTLAVAESCTGGAVSGRFTLLPGASAYLLGAVVAYSNEVKMKILGVSRESLEKYGAVSEAVALEMAEGVRKLTGADYAVATTGIAGPDGGSPEKPVGTVWFAVAAPGKSYAVKKNFGHLREQNIARASSFAINLLRESLGDA